LIGENVADFHGKEAILGGPNQWQVPVSQIDVILLHEIVEDRDFPWWCIRIRLITHGKGDVLGVSTINAVLFTEEKVFDGVCLGLWNKNSQFYSKWFL
jgi:hypothetical protein